jgi:hypothetical protein
MQALTFWKTITMDHSNLRVQVSQDIRSRLF